MKRFFISLFILFAAAATAQNCNENADLITVPGELTAASPKLPGTLKATEKAAVLKTISQMEPLFTKNFSLTGGYAKYWFHNPPEENYFAGNYCTKYYGQIGFYQYVCVNGKKTPAGEFTVDFRVMANPSLDEALLFTGNMYFLADRRKTPGPYIPFCHYLKLNDETAGKITGGDGYAENTFGNNYLKHTDVFRTWYITKPGMPPLLKVSRKEFLQSLLEFFDREKTAYSEEYNRKISDDDKCIERYKKTGNQAMVSGCAEDKAKWLLKLQVVEKNCEIKKTKAWQLLSTQNTAWLEQPAVLDPKIKYTIKNNENADTYFTEQFYNGPNGETVYKWNPALFKLNTGNPGKAAFFKVVFRYKAGETFSENIMKNFVKNFDFESLKKILN